MKKKIVSETRTDTDLKSISKLAENSKSDESNIEAINSKSYIPSPGPSISAWVAGPPPGMIKKPTLFPPENNDNIQPSLHKERSVQSSSSASKLDEVLSSSLLDIGNNGNTWSSSVVSSNTKVAVGPIMSSWTAFSDSPVDIQQYQSFCSPKQENTTVSTDWSMDFALPHDLLSNAADSDEITPKVKPQKERSDRSRSRGDHGSTNRRKKTNSRPMESTLVHRSSNIIEYSSSNRGHVRNGTLNTNMNAKSTRRPFRKKKPSKKS